MFVHTFVYAVTDRHTISPLCLSPECLHEGKMEGFKRSISGLLPGEITEERGDSGMQEKWEMKGWTKGGLAPTPNYTDTRDKLQLTEYLQQSRKHFLCPLTLQRWLQALPCNWAVKKRKGSQNKHLGGEEGDGVYKNWEQMCHRGEGWTREEPFLMSWWLETIIRGSAGRKLFFLSSSKHNSYVASTLTFSPSRTHCPHSDVFLAS